MRFLGGSGLVAHRRIFLEICDLIDEKIVLSRNERICVVVECAVFHVKKMKSTGAEEESKQLF